MCADSLLARWGFSTLNGILYNGDVVVSECMTIACAARTLHDRVGEQYQITIPDHAARRSRGCARMGLKTGDSLDVKVIDGALVMVPFSVKPLSHTERIFGKHRGLWSGEDAVAYIRKERESWRD